MSPIQPHPLLFITFPLAFLFEIGFPILLAAWFVRRGRGSWKLVGIGALVFIGAQALHIPFLSWLTRALAGSAIERWTPTQQLLFNAVVLGLLAGIFEEGARAVAFYLLKDRARTWRQAVSLGIGHGGIESVVFAGLPVLFSFAVMVVYLVNPAQSMNPLLKQQAVAILGTPWHLPLAGLVERAAAITIQITLTVIVLQAFIRRNALYFVGAVLWHALVDFAAVYLSGIKLGVWPLEGVVALLALASLALLIYLIRHEPQPAAEAGEAGLPAGQPGEE